MENQITKFKPQTIRTEVIGQMESMVTSKFISLPENYKESVFFAMEKLSSMDGIENVPSIEITKALIQVFSNKLDFQKNHCYFFVQNDKNSATGKSLRFGWQYQGLISVVKSTCAVKDVYPVLINENDSFDMFYEDGNLTVKNHKPTFEGKLTGGYCVVIYEDGTVKSRYYTMDELEMRRNSSKASKGNFWKWEREMYEKTLVNAFLKRLIETSPNAKSDGLYDEPETIDVGHREVVEEAVLIQNEPSNEPEKVQI
jgi:recombinational DNA repair protein RecT